MNAGSRMRIGVLSLATRWAGRQISQVRQQVLPPMIVLDDCPYCLKKAQGYGACNALWLSSHGGSLACSQEGAA
jgi:hypothetical protein